MAGTAIAVFVESSTGLQGRTEQVRIEERFDLAEDGHLFNISMYYGHNGRHTHLEDWDYSIGPHHVEVEGPVVGIHQHVRIVVVRDDHMLIVKAVTWRLPIKIRSLSSPL